MVLSYCMSPALIRIAKHTGMAKRIESVMNTTLALERATGCLDRMVSPERISVIGNATVKKTDTPMTTIGLEFANCFSSHVIGSEASSVRFLCESSLAAFIGEIG